MTFAPAAFRVLLFSAASNAAVLFVLKFGLFLWPERLPANSQNIFWLASGVNVAGLLVLGLRFWPVLLLNAIPAWIFVGEPLDLTALGSLTNAMEALLAAWLIRGWGRFDGRFDRVRATGALLIASLVAPLVNTLVMPAYFCARGMVAWNDYGEALANWNLANGAGMLLLAPLLVACGSGSWCCRGRIKEGLTVALVAGGLCLVAFNAVFSGEGMNYVFIVFPVVIFAAVRFGAVEVSAVLGLVVFAIYFSLATHARGLPPAEMAETIWFVQAFCWVLAATGLLVAVFESEWRRAERAASVERAQSLELSLREERARLDALRYQLSPHFLFNALNSIYSTLPASGAEVSRAMLARLSGYLRSTLAGREDDRISLHEELLSMEQYLDIQKFRFGDDLHFAVTASDDARECRVPVFLLQPLVENAIIHGFESTRGVFRLEIRALNSGDKLKIEVANTGVWKGPRSGGVGLANTRRRLALMFAGKASLDVEDSAGWVRITIEIPVTND